MTHLQPSRSLLRPRVIALLILALSATTSLQVASADCPGRDRVKIVDNNVVADNGTPLRGAPFMIDFDWGVPHMQANESQYRAYFRTISRDYHFNHVRLCAFVGNYDFDFDDKVYKDRLVYLCDTITDWAQQDGIYVSINQHSQTLTNFKVDRWKKFWDIIAPRYKDRTHVLYEATNEPKVEVAQKFMPAMYQYLRKYRGATQTHIILWSGVKPRDIPLEMIRKYSDGIDYTNASYGFHSYWNCDQIFEEAAQIRKYYPSICTEVHSLTNANDYPVDWDTLRCHLGQAEAAGFSWTQWGPTAHYRGYNPSAQYDTDGPNRFPKDYFDRIGQRWQADYESCD